MRTDKDSGVYMRVLGEQVPHDCQRLIVLSVHAEQKLELRVVLREGGLEVLVEIGVQSLEET